MGIIKKLEHKVIELTEENSKLKTRLTNIENILHNIQRASQKEPYAHITKPEARNLTLDANNIWMGEKGETQYEKLGKLDVYYDEVEGIWKTGNYRLTFVKEGTKIIEVPSWTPSEVDNDRLIYEYAYVDIEESKTGLKKENYMVFIESVTSSWSLQSGSEILHSCGYNVGRFINTHTKKYIFQIGWGYKNYQDSDEGWYLNSFSRQKVHYKIYKVDNGIDLGDFYYETEW